MKRIVVGLSGATGQILGIRLLEALNKVPDVEVHLVVSEWAERTISMETDYTIEQVRALADVCYSCKNVGASIASGSFKHDGMIVMPCSMKTLAAISAGFTSELVSRAADVALKERRKLILAVRETPLHQIHLENMLKLTQMGAVVYPFMPSFYNRPDSMETAIHQYIGRVLSSLDIDIEDTFHWDNNDKINS